MGCVLPCNVSAALQVSAGMQMTRRKERKKRNTRNFWRINSVFPSREIHLASRVVVTQRRQSYDAKRDRENSWKFVVRSTIAFYELQSHRKPASSTRVLARVHCDYPRTTNRYNCSAKYSELETKKTVGKKNVRHFM